MKALICFFLLAVSPAYAQLKTDVYAGGINGLASMIKKDNSDSFRRAGGGLFLHDTGWNQLSKVQKRNLLKVFKDEPIAIEIGFHEEAHLTDMWVANLKEYYIDEGINPHFVTCNLMAEGHDPSLAEWRTRHGKLKKIAPDALILPTFEYANFGKNKGKLARTRVSQTVRFQRIIDQSQGIVIDVPPKVFIQREPNYRMWVIDAIKYAKNRKYMTALIISPDKSGRQFKAHTDFFLRILNQYDALPDVYIVENYIGGIQYPNKVGTEDDQQSILGIAKQIVISR